MSYPDTRRRVLVLSSVRSWRQGKGRAVLVRKHARVRKNLCDTVVANFFTRAKVGTARIPHQSPVPFPYHPNLRC